MHRTHDKQNARCLPLTGCPNFRDLGGYPCTDGKVTVKNRFFRADCLSKLTEQDIALLRELGIKTVIDLREDGERKRAKNPLEGRTGFAYRNISLTDGLQSSEFKGLMPESLSKMYIALTDEAGAEIADVFRALAESDGAVVFHCTAGKDRTGVIAALLLMLAGVAEEDIIADYAMTYSLMKPIFDEQIQSAKLAGIDIPPMLMRSDPENMACLLTSLRERHGNINAYLLSIGMTQREITYIKEAITEDIA